MSKASKIKDVKKSIEVARKKVGKGVKETIEIATDKETGKKVVEALSLLLLL
jgi:hypothetical protein